MSTQRIEGLLPAGLPALIRKHLGTPIIRVDKSAGSLADIYRIRGEDGELIAKCYRQPGQAAREAASLELLRQHSRIALPEIIDVHRAGENGEALLMTVLAGEPASHVLDSPVLIDRFADECTDLLLGWHALHGDGVFQTRAGVASDDFCSSYRAELAALCDWLHGPMAAQLLYLSQRDALLDLARQFDQLPASSATHPSLIHDECHAANFLVDPDTQRLCGVLDPGWVRFSHRELDLRHLREVRPDFRLLETYLAKFPLDDGLHARLAFYSVWEGVRHLQAGGRYNQEELNRKVAKARALVPRAVPA
ncbi:phosphotransferase [Chitinilyticum piscinae]|uniref:Phosphotransferase n=1 Tax=Chitinilyticum piscinae TaxID=2866724 RepID=A0A8J7FLI9_9NEIS|nr:phosphotransferase [Chitinilyticum piscinae]MBE9610292.1 phosphotransferase [Chitinilyticum piscinae]